MPRPSLPLLALVALLAAGCPGRGPAGRAPAGRADGGAPATAANECEARRGEIRGLIDQAPRTCTTAADCSMYPGGPVNCGGVVDRATATRLWQLTDAFRAQRCQYAVHCGPRAVAAVCQSGRCAEELLGRRRP